MTYVSTGNIQATDYNGFVSTTSGGNINATWGTAANGQGYGQINIATVSAGTNVVATQWSQLFQTITNVAAHQGTTITSRSPFPVSGNVIYANANVATDIVACYNNRANAASVGTMFTGYTGTTYKGGSTGSGGSAWTINFTHVITFANTNAYYSFFNAGGTIKWYISKNSTGTVADLEWNAFTGFAGAGGKCAGTIVLTGAGTSKTINGATYVGTNKYGGTLSPGTLASSTGVFNLGTGQTTLFQQNDTGGPYTSNYIRLNALVNSTTAPTTITLYTTWYDNGDGNAGSTAQISGGSATTALSFGSAPATVVTVTPPESLYLANVWGTPTIVASTA